MLKKPELQEQLIVSHLQDNHGLQIARVTFLPIGWDVNAAVYRLDTTDGTPYFFKLRKGAFDEIAVAIPKFLSTQGIQMVMAPLETVNGQLWGRLGDYATILYPFVAGRDGYEVALSEQQWVRFGQALKGIHEVQPPDALLPLLPREHYSPFWRDIVRTFQAQIADGAFDDPVAAKLAAFMNEQRDVISHILDRADQLGHDLSNRSMEFVLCHSDIHPGNLLIVESAREAPDGFYIVDWDSPILAPKERDLLLIGGCTTWNDARQEALFYQGYGSHAVDQMAMAYYRYERVIDDLAVDCQQLFLTNAGSEDREPTYHYFVSNFLPGHEIEMAEKQTAIKHHEEGLLTRF